MKIFLTVKTNDFEYLTSRKIDVFTSGDFFKQLFIHRDVWDTQLNLYIERKEGEKELIGTLHEIYHMPLIELCRIAAKYYGVNRFRAERIAVAANKINFGGEVIDIEQADHNWR